MAGEPRPLLAQRFLCNLNDDLLAGLEHLGNQLRPARLRPMIVMAHLPATVMPAAPHGALEASSRAVLDARDGRLRLLLCRGLNWLDADALFARFHVRRLAFGFGQGFPGGVGLLCFLIGLLQFVGLGQNIRGSFFLLAEVEFLHFVLSFLVLRFGELLGERRNFVVGEVSLRMGRRKVFLRILRR